MRLYTIGFTKKSAEQFFGLLEANGVTRLVDIRLHPGGQLAGFTKKDDLAFFLSRLLECEYRHEVSLAPTAEMLSEYRSDHDWAEYEKQFEQLMEERGIPKALNSDLFADAVCCLLCSEPTPEHCHRRLVAERLKRFWPGTEVIHLV